MFTKERYLGAASSHQLYRTTSGHVRKAPQEAHSALMTELVIKATTKLGFESERIEPIEHSIIGFLKVIDYSQLTSAMAPIFYGVSQRQRFSFFC